MGKRRIGLIPGDGIGPEIVQAAVAVLEAAGLEADWIKLDAGLTSIQKGRPAVPPETVEAISDVGVALKGPTTTPSGGGHKSANVQLRQALDLFANVRPAKTLPGVDSPVDKEIDLIIVRENTEGLYAGIEFQPHPDIAQAVKVTTRPGCRRLHKYAFQMVRREGRKRISAVHKANIMKLTDGMFLDEFYKVASEYPDVQADEIIVDNCCMQLVIRPETFDVLVTENLYGDIVSDLCAGLVGGLGLAPGANIGEKCAVFEAVHGSAPDIAGKGLANPTALLLSGVMMLRHLGMNESADKVMSALLSVFAEGKTITRDVGGSASTTEFVEQVIRNISDAPRLASGGARAAAGRSST